MPNPHPQRLRQRAVLAYEAGEGTYAELSERYALGARTLERWVQRYRESGEVEARPRGGGWRSPVVLELVHEVVASEPDASTEELTKAYNARAAIAVSRSAFLRALRRAGYVFKKNAGGQRSKIVPTS